MFRGTRVPPSRRRIHPDRCNPHECTKNFGHLAGNRGFHAIKHLAWSLLRTDVHTRPTSGGSTMAQKLPFRSGIKYGGLPGEAEPISICCVCGLVRARKTFTAESERWITCRAYEQRYGVALAGRALTHTYCSGCY